MFIFHLAKYCNCVTWDVMICICCAKKEDNIPTPYFYCKRVNLNHTRATKFDLREVHAQPKPSPVPDWTCQFGKRSGPKRKFSRQHNACKRVSRSCNQHCDPKHWPMSTAPNTGHDEYPLDLDNTIARNSVERALGVMDEDEHVHLASLTEKKRLWWRNAVINGAFIVSW